jgi:hypothetical protein
MKNIRFIPNSTLNRLQSAGIHLRYGKLSSRRLAHRAEDRIFNGLSKTNSLIKLTPDNVSRVILSFHMMQPLPGIP